MWTQQVGKLGETYARKYFETHGYRLIAKNWHCRYGEIDVILAYGDKIIFCEVKSRISENFGAPEESLDRKKMQKLVSTVQCYLEKNPIKIWQVDLIAIRFDYTGTVQSLKHYQNLGFQK